MISIQNMQLRISLKNLILPGYEMANITNVPDMAVPRKYLALIIIIAKSCRYVVSLEILNASAKHQAENISVISEKILTARELRPRIYIINPIVPVEVPMKISIIDI